MAIKILNPATVSAADTATRITAGQTNPATRVMALWAQIQADKDNGNTVYIGDSTVMNSTTDRGIILSVTDGDAFPAQITLPSTGVPFNLADIYFSSSVLTSKVSIIYQSV